MTEFKSWRSYWRFASAVRRGARYIHDQSCREFLQALLTTGLERQKLIASGSILWRAQLGSDWEPLRDDDGKHIDDVPAPHPPNRMKPLPDRALEGRANPVGIPCLYLATERDTALSEVRPWIGAAISIAQMKTVRELRLLDFTLEPIGQTIYFCEPEPKERERVVWADINRAFAEPVTRSDDSADYVPTQIIAELFKTNGFDGVLYRSALGPGNNLALFDLDSAKLINCALFRVTRLSLEFQEVANPYFIRG